MDGTPGPVAEGDWKMVLIALGKIWTYAIAFGTVAYVIGAAVSLLASSPNTKLIVWVVVCAATAITAGIGYHTKLMQRLLAKLHLAIGPISPGETSRTTSQWLDR